MAIDYGQSTSMVPQTIMGEGLVTMESPDGYSVKHFIRFGFKSSNNVTLYEATLAVIDLEKNIKAKKILIMSDSWLVVRQSTRVFEAKEESVNKYQEKIRKRVMNFAKVNLQYIPKIKNKKANALTKLASLATADMNITIHFEEFQFL